VSLVGIVGDKAVLSIDHGSPHVLSTGSSSGAVQVLSVNSDRAVLMIDGRRETIMLGQFYGSTSGGRATATLLDDGHGAFVANGVINGRSVRFIADTGATFVVISGNQADQIGLAWRGAPQAYAQTANGTVLFHRVQIPTIRVGDIVLNNIDAAVQEQGLGNNMALLGQSFLNRTEMSRSGGTMTLTKRF
jgi:aspartyl protease family protein